MPRATKFTLLLAGFCACLSATSASASVYLTEDDQRTRVLVVDPFSRLAMDTLSRINGSNIAAANETPVLSIDNVLDRQTFDHPEYGTSFRLRRTIVFDIDTILTQTNAALEPYRKNGCSKFKISSPELASLSEHAMKLRVDMSFKKRACDNYLGTHDLASGHGHAIIVGDLRSEDGYPRLEFAAEDIDIDTDSVLGINPNSLFGRIVRLLTVDLARLLGGLTPIRGTVGELQFKLFQPISRLAKAESINAAQAQYSARELEDIVRGYGNLSEVLRNADAWKLKFDLEASGMVRRAQYRLRPEHAETKDPKLCSEIGPGSLRDYYCVPTGESKLTLRVVQTSIYAEDSRAFVEGYYRREAIYLSSLSHETEIKYYPSHIQYARIVDENYLDKTFHPFFRENNVDADCTTDLSPGRARSTGETLCRYKIVPAYLKILNQAPQRSAPELPQ